ncbi:MAG: SMP-30/gluconolactonase/LRE family protein, partial [Verrucomicrobiota bacterium]
GGERERVEFHHNRQPLRMPKMEMLTHSATLTSRFYASLRACMGGWDLDDEGMRIVALNLVLGLFLMSTGFLSAQEKALESVLISGKDWELVADEPFDFTDGLCTDLEGNLYFSDVRSGTAVYRVDLSGNVSEFVKEAPGISGLQFGADGRLFACVARGKKVAVFDEKGKEIELASDVRPNDLVVTYSGDLFFTMTPTQEIRRIDSQGKMTVVNVGAVTKPNGISLSPDQKTLAVSDHGGKHVWTFPILDDGSLGEAKAAMTLKLPEGEEVAAKGDGMATDSEGRYYSTSAEGLQVFSKSGERLGIISAPTEGNLVSVCFAGAGHKYLYVAGSGKVYRRETKTAGALFFAKPQEAAGK